MIAYEDIGGIQIKDTPTEEARVPNYSIDSKAAAERILKYAREHRSDLLWSIKESSQTPGKFGVFGRQE
jgi:hypothetical protein